MNKEIRQICNWPNQV